MPSGCVSAKCLVLEVLRDMKAKNVIDAIAAAMLLDVANEDSVKCGSASTKGQVKKRALNAHNL
jgi:hypothetical protein